MSIISNGVNKLNNIDEQKFLEFYDQHITRIYRYVYFRVGSEETAQDLSSEAFLKTWQYLKDGKEIGNLSAMIYQVCRNLIADYFRKNKSLPINLDDISEMNLNETEFTDNSFQAANINFELDQIKERIKLLRDEYQDLIVWHYVNDLQIKEIAQILDKSEGSIRTSLSRALKALKAGFEGENV